MPDAVVIPPIPTLIHLMVVDAPQFHESNMRVVAVEQSMPELLAPPGPVRSVNSIWAPAGLRFELDGTRTVPYRPEDIGLTPEELEEEGLEIPGQCNPESEHEQRIFRAIQERFGQRGFRGLQVFIWAHIAAGGGCAMSQPAGAAVGAVWLEPHSLAGAAGVRLMAHEIGHFLTLRHVEQDSGPKRLMTEDARGTHLIADELTRARHQAGIVMEL
jgi:hypothetical protein